MVELLAAIPSVVLGLWGILVFGPWVAEHLEPWLRDAPRVHPAVLGRAFYQAGMLPAALVLTIMIIPITSAICRELFSRTPRDLMDGALALGSTRWEAIRGVMFAYAAPGIAAAVLLGLGRAFGEAIAVAQVIGGSDHDQHLAASRRPTRSARGSRRSTRARRRRSRQGSLLYLGAILMVISLVDERRRAVHREQVREAAEGRVTSSRPRAPTTRTTSPSARTGCGGAGIVEKAFGSLAILSALSSRSAILALVLGTVLFKGLESLDCRSSPSRARCSARRAASRTRSSAAR